MDGQWQRDAERVQKHQAASKSTAAFGAVVLGGIGSSAQHTTSNVYLFFIALPQWAIVVLAALTGVGLFLLRKRNRPAYGFVEIMFAVFALIQNSGADRYGILTLPWTVALVGSIYILVRGLSNIDEGWAQQPVLAGPMPTRLTNDRMPLPAASSDTSANSSAESSSTASRTGPSHELR